MLFEMEFVHRFYDQEKDKGDQKEIDDGGNKGAVGEHCGIFSASYCESQRGKIYAAGDQAEQGIEDILHQ